MRFARYRCARFVRPAHGRPRFGTETTRLVVDYPFGSLGLVRLVQKGPDERPELL